MVKVVNIKDGKRSHVGRTRRFENLKEELLRGYGIDLDQLMSNEPATNLTVEQFEDLTERILSVVDDFCEENQQVTIHDVLYTLENVKDIIKDNTNIEDDS
jgi:spore coat polysaccharide biosynthesis protein SpsF (cytidylyltransferase family)